MFKYFKYTPVSDEYTTHIYRADKANYFDGNVVSVPLENATEQNPLIQATEITLDEFKALVADSSQIQRCRDAVAESIAAKYTIADELAMLKRDTTDPKRIAYEAFVDGCKIEGDNMKAALGYL